MVIVGRPNVGKSTLFNRLLRRRVAIVHPQPGVTRDRLVGEAEWRGQRFRVVDTGGVTDPPDGEAVEAAVWDQVQQALARADLVLLVLDAREGLAPHDREWAERLRRSGLPVLVVANKVDHPGLEAAAWEFAALGLGEPIPVAAATGRNMGQLLDAVVQALPRRQPMGPDQAGAEPVRVAIVGRPNVGKSSLLNAIVGEPRVAVHPVAGTTRDAVDVSFTYGDRQVVLVDTAGIRRRAHRPQAATVEGLAVGRALAAMERADVAVVVLDAGEGVTFQDARLAAHAARRGCGVVLAVNKWDLVDPSGAFREEYARQVQHAAARLQWAPVCFISALRGWRIRELLETCLQVADRRACRLDDRELWSVIARAQARRPHPARGGHSVRIVRAWQAAGSPPVVALAVRGAERLDADYLRYLENQLRGHFDLTGTPVRWQLHAESPSRRVIARRPGP